MDPVVPLTVRCGLALLLVVAAGHKLADRRAFARIVGDYQLVPQGAVAGAAAAIVAGEVIAVLLLAFVPAAGALVTVTLLAAYGVAIALNLRRGRRHIDCGCVGPAARQPIGEWMLARNAGLALAAATLWLPVRARGLTWVDALTVVATTAAAAGLYAAVQELAAHRPAIARMRGDA